MDANKVEHLTREGLVARLHQVCLRMYRLSGLPGMRKNERGGGGERRRPKNQKRIVHIRLSNDGEETKTRNGRCESKRGEEEDDEEEEEEEEKEEVEEKDEKEKVRRTNISRKKKKERTVDRAGQGGARKEVCTRLGTQERKRETLGPPWGPGTDPSNSIQ